jgi:hypothetical protein
MRWRRGVSVGIFKLSGSLLLNGRPYGYAPPDGTDGTWGVEARVRLRVGHLGGHLVSRAVGGSADHAVRLAIAKLERQLRSDR